MNEFKPEAAAEAASGALIAPKIEESPRFSASPREILGALAMYIAAYIYVCCLLPPGRIDERVMILCFTLCFVALTELIHRTRPRNWESWVWLGCAAILLAGILRPGGLRVWGGFAWPILHLFAVWWALSRSGALLEGESGHLAPLDAVNGFIVFPFKHFVLRIRTVWYALTHIRNQEQRTMPLTILSTALASAAAVGLLVLAVSLLMQADTGFASLVERLTTWFRIETDEELLLRVLFSLPVGAYLFGLIAGTGREEQGKLREQGVQVRRWLETLRKVPDLAWLILTALFCAVYIVFFAVHTHELFGAFVRRLPEGYIVSQYALEGFFEMGKVMAVNFALLWLVTRSSRERGKALKWLCLFLLSESLLFAVIAFSKLALYIDNFGFTPKRIQGAWAIFVLSFGCVCAAVSLLTKRKTFRIWMIFGAVTFSLLALV